MDLVKLIGFLEREKNNIPTKILGTSQTNRGNFLSEVTLIDGPDMGHSNFALVIDGVARNKDFQVGVRLQSVKEGYADALENVVNSSKTWMQVADQRAYVCEGDYRVGFQPKVVFMSYSQQTPLNIVDYSGHAVGLVDWLITNLKHVKKQQELPAETEASKKETTVLRQADVDRAPSREEETQVMRQADTAQAGQQTYGAASSETEASKRETNVLSPADTAQAGQQTYGAAGGSPAVQFNKRNLQEALAGLDVIKRQLEVAVEAAPEEIEEKPPTPEPPKEERTYVSVASLFDAKLYQQIKYIKLSVPRGREGGHDCMVSVYDGDKGTKVLSLRPMELGETNQDILNKFMTEKVKDTRYTADPATGVITGTFDKDPGRSEVSLGVVYMSELLKMLANPEKVEE